MPKRGIGINVYQAAQERISWTFDTFPRIYVSFSGGKDSTVMLHLVAEEAARRGRKFGVMFVDLEGQYNITITHIEHCFDLYSDLIEPHWVCLPIHLRNAVSQFENQWVCWEPGREADWVRPLPRLAINDQTHYPFYRYSPTTRPMEFEEFVPKFGKWFASNQACACFVGIRSDESLNRYRTIAGHGTKMDGKNWTQNVAGPLWNVYPIYDWRTDDIWIYHGKHPEKPYNKLYDYMYKAGLTIHQMRICQPYGDDQRKGLWLFHLIEPETWSRIVARVNGANGGALYAEEAGNILGRIKISKPNGHTWQSFSELLLNSMPPKTADHFRDKIATFLNWWQTKSPEYIGGIPDEADPKEEAAKQKPSWRRICKTLLRYDFWCKGLSFTQTKSEAYNKYKKIMKKRRRQWGIYS
jgi:predicted phosphoadenosine phosphosulfate sulfurtransferase